MSFAGEGTSSHAHARSELAIGRIARADSGFPRVVRKPGLYTTSANGGAAPASEMDHDRRPGRTWPSIYTAPPPLLLCDDGDYRVFLRLSVSGRVGKGKASLEESVTFEIETAVPRPLSELQRRVRVCTDFLSIACLSHCEIDELEPEHAESADHPKQRGTFHAVPLYRSREKASIVHMLFRGGEVEKRLPDIFTAWWSHAESLFDVRACTSPGALRQRLHRRKAPVLDAGGRSVSSPVP